MQEKENFEKLTDTAEWLDFSITQYLYDVQRNWIFMTSMFWTAMSRWKRFLTRQWNWSGKR